MHADGGIAGQGQRDRQSSAVDASRRGSKDMQVRNLVRTRNGNEAFMGQANVLVVQDLFFSMLFVGMEMLSAIDRLAFAG